MNFIGIDPGKTGALILLDSNCKIKFKAIIPLIGRQIDLYTLDDYFKNLKNQYSDDLHIILEDVHSLFSMSAKSNFSFGHTNGVLEGIIASNRIKYTKVQPKTWQSTVWQGIRPITINTGKKKTNGDIKIKIDTKQTTLLAIKRLFPNEDFTKSLRSKKDDSGLVDSTALAYYGYVKFK